MLISIHAPREGGDGFTMSNRRCGHISIHAPREGGDVLHRINAGALAAFQSTPPARGATLKAAGGLEAFKISIHAPREGGDL